MLEKSLKNSFLRCHPLRHPSARRSPLSISLVRTNYHRMELSICHSERMCWRGCCDVPFGTVIKYQSKKTYLDKPTRSSCAFNSSLQSCYERHNISVLKAQLFTGVETIANTFPPIMHLDSIMSTKVNFNCITILEPAKEYDNNIL